jgi:hypothetical protein
MCSRGSLYEFFAVHPLSSVIYTICDRFQRPYGLRGSAAVVLLGLRVRIPPGHESLSLVNVARCSVEVSATF